MSTNYFVGSLADKHFRRPRCIAAGCKLPAVDGLSYCSEDHYEELVEERKAKNGYRTGSPLRAHDFTEQLKPPKASSVHVATVASKMKQVKASKPKASKAAAPEKEMPAQQYEDKEVEAILCQTAQFAKESSDEWRSGQEVAQGTGAIKGLPDAPVCRCGHPADAHVRGHHGDSECKRPFCYCGNYDTRPDSASISEQAAAAIVGSLQPEKQPANPYDLVIADMEKRRDHLADAIRLMQALRDSGV